MKLKKNDKIILIIGVVILIAAGAGIALYNIEDDDGSIAEDSQGDYKVVWAQKEETMALWEGNLFQKICH